MTESNLTSNADRTALASFMERGYAVVRGTPSDGLISALLDSMEPTRAAGSAAPTEAPAGD